MSISEWVFVIGVFAKQFYILPSGSLQMGDILMLGAVGMSSVSHKFVIRKSEEKLLIFFTCAIGVNAVYSFLYHSALFYKYSAYFVFNFLIVCGFREFVNSKPFLCAFQKVLKLNIFMQALIYFSGKGRWYDAGRYKGTFNDPNQYGYFLLISIGMILTIDIILNQKSSIFWVVFTTITISVSGSIGMTGACVLLLIYELWNLKIKHWSSGKIALALILVLATATVILLFMDQWKISEGGINKKAETITVLWRIREKFWQIKDGTLILSIAKDRSMLKVLKYPWMMLYGAGEGMYERILSGEGNEIHSTMIGLLFYYGIIPYSFLVAWIIRNVKQQRKAMPVMIVLIAEAFTIINHRQPFFWMSFVLAGTIYMQEEPNHSLKMPLNGNIYRKDR